MFIYSLLTMWDGNEVNVSAHKTELHKIGFSQKNYLRALFGFKVKKDENAKIVN